MTATELAKQTMQAAWYEQQGAFLSMQLNNVTICLVLVYTMPQTAKQMAIRDITAALEASALRHNIAQRFSLNEVAAAHEAQDSGKMIGKAIIEIT